MCKARYGDGMGNREDLLAGARRVILEKGVAGATARDIAGAAGVSLAAIGYHFGSKERLITEALTQAMGQDLGDRLDTLIRESGPGRGLPEAFAVTWDGMRELVERNRDGLLLSFENGLRVARTPELQAFMAEAVAGGYAGMAETLLDVYPELPDAQAQAIGQLYFVLLHGMAMMWLLSPDVELPDGDALALAVSALATPRSVPAPAPGSGSRDGSDC
jgi:AcrR family transcriptional regulator